MHHNEKENQRNKKSYLKNLIILLVGIILWILAYLINTYPDQYLEGFLFIISLPLIGYGYISLMVQIKLETACLIEGIIALIIPLLLSSIFLLIYIDCLINWYVIIFITTLGILSLIMGIVGYLKTKQGRERIGRVVRVVLFITLVIGTALSFGVATLQI
ncbi:MAG: hypothetical protein A7315_09545 [Candidatus Altiarchaeales archaeon WOR_SM1_79]|jgi:hypothetical protein|nr:MAG: hypothetical protein A7315_09545 [Candidatus Altiarchaeales archaeon WOR_SM1_79]